MKIEINLFNNSGCGIGSFTQNVNNPEDTFSITKAVIDCLNSNKVVLAEGDSIKIEY